MERIIPQITNSLTHAERLQNAIEVLKAWHKEYGTLGNIKTNDVFEYNGETVNMKYFITKIRTRYNKGTLNQETIKCLESMIDGQQSGHIMRNLVH